MDRVREVRAWARVDDVVVSVVVVAVTCRPRPQGETYALDQHFDNSVAPPGPERPV